MTEIWTGCLLPDFTVCQITILYRDEMAAERERKQDQTLWKKETGPMMISIRKISYIAIILHNFFSCFFYENHIYIKMVKYCCKSLCSENLFGDFPTEEWDPIYVWSWQSAGQPKTSQMRSLLSKKSRLDSSDWMGLCWYEVK